VFPKTATIIISAEPRKRRCAKALALAEALVSVGTPVNVFLLSGGVYLAVRDLPPGQAPASKDQEAAADPNLDHLSEAEGFPDNVAEVFERLCHKGVRFRASEACLKESNLSRDRLDPHVELASLVDLANWLNESSQALHF
jgi:sulfur relay (sulfurtransferase) complex TusBCD TusD component (DsrE family)